jgi:hypothetical protein
MHCLHISIVIKLLAAFEADQQRPHILCLQILSIYLPRKGDGRLACIQHLHWRLELRIPPPGNGFRNCGWG